SSPVLPLPPLNASGCSLSANGCQVALHRDKLASLSRVFQAEQLSLFIVGEQLSIARPRDNRLQRFPGIVFRHIIFEFVAEARRPRFRSVRKGRWMKHG